MALVINPQLGRIEVDPGYVPDFHKIIAIGLDATDRGEWGACRRKPHIRSIAYFD